MKLLVINGPNLNFLGIREKGIYGVQTYQDLLDMIARKGISCRAAIEVFQSNHEGVIVDKIQEAEGVYDGIIINPGPFTQYSHAIRVTLGSVNIPSVEVHLVNIFKTGEPSIPGKNCTGVICGFGINCYLLGVDALRHTFLDA